jgi:hypothetical protein
MVGTLICGGGGAATREALPIPLESNIALSAVEIAAPSAAFGSTALEFVIGISDPEARANDAVLGLKQPSSLYSRRNKRDLLRQPTNGGFSTIGTIVTIHRRGTRDRSSWTDRTVPKNFDPFKLSSAVRPLYWA